MTTKHILKSFAALAAGFLLLSCTQEEETELTLSVSVANFAATSASPVSVVVTSNADWTVSCTESWVEVSPAAGSNDGSFKISVKDNPAFSDRNADVVVTAGSLTAMVSVTQLALTPALSVSPTTVNADVEGLTQKLTIQSNAEWTLTIPAEAEWIAADKLQGKGDAEVTLTIAPSAEYEARSAEITVKGEGLTAKVAVNQLGLTPGLEVSPESLDTFTVEGGKATIEVTANVSWLVYVTEAEWIHIDTASGKNNGQFVITVDANETFEERSTTVTVKSIEFGDLVKEIAVAQEAMVPTLSLSAEQLNVTNAAGALNVDVNSNAPWTVSVEDGCDWVTVSPAEGDGNGVVSVAFSANRELTARSAAVTFKEGVSGKEAVLTVNQQMGEPTRYTDSLALVAVFNATGGADNWHQDRVWDLSKPINEWYNIKINDAGRVTQINMAKGTVTAAWSLPAEIGHLTEMTNFRIIGCNLTGSIPEEIYNLTKLVSLYLTNNTPTWTLSPKIALMTDLKDLYIDQNANLSGELPKELGTLKKLVNINVSQTSVSGAIPAEMSGCESLNNLMGFKTQLSGVPDNLDQWPALKLIQLYGNPNMTGALPASVGNCTKLTSVWFYECNFTGNIPESWANLPATCKQLRIQDNKLSGVVPAAVQAHANWGSWNAAKYILPQQDGYGLTLE